MASQEERDRIMAEYLAQVGDEDDDEEEEAEFVPGYEGDSDEEEEPEDDDDDDFVWMKGTLVYENGRLVYKGHVEKDSFELISKQDPLHWTFQHPTEESKDDTPQKMRTIAMEGTMGKHSTTVDLTLTATTASEDAHAGRKEDSSLKPAAAAKRSESDNEDGKMPSKPAAAKSSVDEDGKIPAKPPAAAKQEDEDDGKMLSKPSATDDGKKPAAAAQANGGTTRAYSVFGRGSGASGAYEFYGTLMPTSSDKQSLDCQKRAVVKTAPVASAAAAYDDDDDDDAGEDMDYDELIALHQDAGLPITELRKRYNSSQTDEPASKKSKAEESDDEYGF